jgi:hypothetical protein
VSSPRVRAWLKYAVVGLVVVAAVAGAASLLVSPANRTALWFGAGLGWVLQLIAFGVLLAFRHDPQLFLLGWAVGMAIRFASLGVAAYWLSRSEVLPLEAGLLSLVGFVVLLLFMEPLFLRGGQATK